MRTVSGDADEVGAQAGDDVALELLDTWVGAGERTNQTRGGAQHPRLDAGCIQRTIDAADLGVAEAVKGQLGLQRDGAGVGKGELVLLLGAAQVLDVQLTIGVERFRVTDDDVLTRPGGCP